VLWSPSGKATDLGAILGPAWSRTEAQFINDLGDIAGYGQYKGGFYGLLLTPNGVNSWALASVSAARLADPSSRAFDLGDDAHRVRRAGLFRPPKPHVETRLRRLSRLSIPFPGGNRWVQLRSNNFPNHLGRPPGSGRMAQRAKLRGVLIGTTGGRNEDEHQDFRVLIWGRADRPLVRRGRCANRRARACGEQHGFLRTPTGAFTTFDPPGSTFTYVGSISTNGEIAGAYCNTAGRYGFVRARDGAFTTFASPGPSSGILPGVYAVAPPPSINPAGAVAGTYFDSSGNKRGFVRD